MARLGRRQGDGVPLRDHLEAVWRATGNKPAELDVPPLPPSLAPLWQVYLQLDAGRNDGGFGAAAVGWQDLAAWQRITRQPLTGWEAEALIRTDRAVRAILNAT